LLFLGVLYVVCFPAAGRGTPPSAAAVSVSKDVAGRIAANPLDRFA
jgi:hypothetical protein